MIDAEYCRYMARYNAWQNKGLRAIVAELDDATITQECGLFFGSIMATLNHILWGDAMWMSRFDDSVPKPELGIADSKSFTRTSVHWSTERFRMDGRIRHWADNLGSLDLVGNLVWFSGAINRELSKPKAMCIAHFFNHQTHHRGQVHGALTRLGHSLPDTDLVLLPEDG